MEETRFCPRCGGEITPATLWQQVTCDACQVRSYSWELRSFPRLSPGRFLLYFFWGLCPAILLVAGLQVPPAAANSAYGIWGSALTNVAVHGSPAILYSWSALLLRHRRVRWYWLVAIPQAMFMIFLNALLVVLGVFLLP